MARNSSGTMSAPGSYPPVADTIISLDDYKTLVQDVLDEITDSLSRSGDGGMLAALKLADGSQALPGLSFVNDATSGLYRTADEVRVAVLGALIAKFKATGLDVTGALTASGAISGTTGTFSGGLANDASHGNRGNGALHTAATVVTAGFMSAADKTKLDALPTDAVSPATLAAAAPAAGKVIAGAKVLANGSAVGAFGLSVAHTGSTGVYTVTLSAATANPIPMVCAAQSTPAIVSARLTAADQVTVETTVSGLQDAAFNITVFAGA